LVPMSREVFYVYGCPGAGARAAVEDKPAMFAGQFRVDPDHFRLQRHEPAYTGKWSELDAQKKLAEDIVDMARLQDRFHADGRQALLIILQALDAAGKDSVIKHVMTGLNPASCRVHSFQAPTAEELRHDYLWRCVRVLPERGQIGIFNRSYYEEVLVVRVHPEFLAAEKLGDPGVGSKKFWKRRFKQIVRFEDYLTHNVTRVVKFFLHLSRQEQKKRFLQRIDDPNKNWKLTADDYQERRHWDEYQAAYEDMLRQTSTKRAPWYVIPADNKWFTRLAVANIIVATLRELHPRYPDVSASQRAQLKRIRELLEREDE
jgi:PPK2 family polyphosphate:nucleotide phosphotransferase